MIASTDVSREALEKKLAEKFELPKGHPLEKLVSPIAECIVSQIDFDEQFDTFSAFIKHRTGLDDDDLDEEDYDGGDSIESHVKRAFERGLKVVVGDFSSDWSDSGLDLTEVGFDVHEDDFMLVSDEGY
jgi:hypothetical protein